LNKEEKNRVDRITESVYYLLKGQIPNYISCDDDPHDEIKQLSEMVNKLIKQFQEIQQTLKPLSSGNLDIEIPKDNILASPFKQLHASLSHLTWQTRQIAMGDYNQKVDFMGDFSQAFNTMTNSLKESQEHLNFEIEKFKQLAELKNNYLNIMAHDIRTPIGAIIGFSDILLESDLPEHAIHYVDTIKRNSDYLLNLINNILDLAKLEKKKMELEWIPFSLETIGSDIGKLIGPKLSPQTQFVFTYDQTIPKNVLGDPNKLRQVLINLVGNSAKFTQEGSITLDIKNNGKKDNDKDQLSLHISIKDTGIGIAEENLAHLFLPFAQENKSIASKYGGTGLGLSISKEIVELMGGHLHVKSKQGQGTEFYFDILVKYHHEQTQKVTSQSKHCHILVVDNDPEILEIVAHHLEKKKVFFSVCDDSTKVCEILNQNINNQTPYTLAMLDIEMPKLSGIELAKKIKSNPLLKLIRLVAFTSHTEELTQTIDPSLFSFVAKKPITDAILEKIIKEANYSFENEKDFCSLLNKKILIVDDNAINRFVVKRLLEKQHMIVDEAENGKISIQKVDQNKYDFVLMDHLMPEMDGIESIETIRKNPLHHHLNIIAYTANDDPQNIEEFLKTGANSVVKKPVNSEDLIQKLCSFTH